MTANARRNFCVRLALGAAIALTFLFIFGNSLQSRAVSGSMSSALASFLSGTFGLSIPEFFLRKAAHFSEYALLGIEFSLLLNLTRDKNGRTSAHGHNFLDFPALGLLTAVFDETLQIFSGRGSMVADVWIDFAGFVTGFFVTAAVFLLLHNHKKRKDNKK